MAFKAPAFARARELIVQVIDAGCMAPCITFKGDLLKVPVT